MSFLEENMNSIVCGDCLEVMKKIPDGSIDLILTDPPYGIDFLSCRTKNHKKIENDKFDDFMRCMPKWLEEFKRIISDNGCCCCCCGGGGKSPVSQIFTLKAVEIGFNLIQTVIWNKKTIGLGWRYRPSYETIIVLSKSKDKYNWYTSRNDISNIVNIGNIIPQKGGHPTPQACFTHAVFYRFALFTRTPCFRPVFRFRNNSHSLP